MAEVWTNEDDLKAMIRGLSRKLGHDTLDLIECAAAVGWKVVVTSPESVSLIAPGDPSPKRIHLSARNRGKAPIKKMMSQIRRYGEPALVSIIEGAAREGSLDDQSFGALIKAAANLSAADFVLEVPEPSKKEERHVAQTAAVATPTPAVVAEVLAKKPAKPERHIISERPALMHHGIKGGVGRSYPSTTTIERRWSDGEIDYTCAVPTCDKTSTNRLSFRGAHWAMHVRNGEAQPYDADEAKRTLVEDPTYTEHAWSRKGDLREKRTTSLIDLLKGIDLSKVTPEELAEQIMEFLGDNGGGNGNGGLPLTPEQIIDRIRSLVDTGVYSEQEQAIRDRDQQIEDLMTYAEQREQELADQLFQMEQKAAKAEATLEAFRDLVIEALPQQQKEEG